jgi:amidase
MTIINEKWASIAQEKQQRNLNQIPAEWRIDPVESVHVMDVPVTCGVLGVKEIRITDTAAEDLVAQMSSGALKSVDVVTAFAKRAAIAHQLASLLHCATERC